MEELLCVDAIGYIASRPCGLGELWLCTTCLDTCPSHQRNENAETRRYRVGT